MNAEKRIELLENEKGERQEENNGKKVQRK